MQDAVDESGMSRGGVYSYFSSTEEMIQAIHIQNQHDLPVLLESIVS